MALSRELSRHLNDEASQPLSKRLKLAENAFISSDFMLPRKEDIILNWLCEVSKGSNDIATWQTLERCLEFKHNHLYASTIKAPVKTALVEALINALKTDSELELTRAIVSCCQSIILNKEIQRYFVYKPILIVDLLEQLLSCSLTQTSIMICEDDIGKLSKLNEGIIDSLNVLIECHRRLTNKTELRHNVIGRLVYKLCVFSEKVSNEKVTSTVNKCIQKFIFDKSIEMKEFESENWTQELYTTLSQHSKNPSYDNNIILVISYVFHTAILSFKSFTSTIDTIYRSLLNCAPSLVLKIHICCDLFRHFNDITLDIQNKINDTTLMSYYHRIIDEILALDHLDDNAYKCLSGIAKFNPLIIENKLPTIFKIILLAKKSSDIIKSSYINLMCDILDACIRLRRENKLVPWILIALDESLQDNRDHPINIDDILPPNFTDNFTISISNVTNALATELLQTFIYHLDVSSLQSPNSVTLPITMEVTSRLFIAFLDGIHIYDYSTPPVMQKKFNEGLVKLGKVLVKLVKVVTPINKYEAIAIPVLSVVNCWQKIIAFMKKYAPESLTEENELSITQIIKSVYRRIDRTDPNLPLNNNVKQLLNCCQLEKCRIDNNTQLDGNAALDDVENNWPMLMDTHSYIIMNLNDIQLSNLARALLCNALDTTTVIPQISRIESRIVQQNEKLIVALIFETLTAIQSMIKNSSSVTKNILVSIEGVNLMESKCTGKILKVCKKLLSDPQWVQNKYSTSIVQYLNVLQALPLIHLREELKKIIFLVVFSMTKEWADSSIIDLCHQILTDLSEGSNIDFLQYINLNYLIEELPKLSVMHKILENSLRNIENYNSIATFIKCHKNVEDSAASIVIECIEKIKPKLKSDEKIIARKIEKKWCKKVINAVGANTKNPYEVKSLRVALKAAVTMKKIDEAMLDTVHSILHNIFETNDKDEDHPKLRHNFNHDDALVNEGLQIIKILLHPSLKNNERINKILNKDIVKRTWSLMLTKSSDDIVHHLLDVQRTTPKILKKILNLLEKQTVDAHKQQDKLIFENSMNIWSCVFHTDMSTSSNHIRQLFSQQLMQYFSYATLSNDDRLSVLKLCTIIINTKRMHITEKMIDLILLTVQNFLTNLQCTSSFVCDQVLTLCLAFVTHRVNIIIDRLPVLLILYRRVIRFIIDESKAKNSSCTEHQLRCLALNANKLTVALVKLKKDMSKISPYVIADIIEMYSEGVIPTFVKEPLDDCIGMLLSNCDHHAIPLLMRALPSAMQEIFKTLYDTYNKFYKFFGKI